MISDRQRAANHANARKSTGPTSSAGKARSAGNSRRHGLTARPDPTQVQNWFRVILDDPGALVDPFERDPLRRAARDLAETEAQLARIRLAEERNYASPAGDPSEPDMITTEEHALIRDALTDDVQLRELFGQSRNRFSKESFQTPREYERWTKSSVRLILRAQVLAERETQQPIKSQERLGKTLARYRATAEARRRRALRRFISEITKRTQFLS